MGACAAGSSSLLRTGIAPAAAWPYIAASVVIHIGYYIALTGAYRHGDLGLTYLFITHDLAVVRVIADEVCVMNKGQIVEAGTTSRIFESSTQEYTKNLLEAIPGAKIRLGS